jgi:hypothetical protein
MSITIQQNTFNNFTSKTAKVVEGGSQLEKILKLVVAILKPFETIPLLPALPVFLGSVAKSCSQATEVSAGVKVLARPNDFVKGKWKESGARGLVQLVSFTAAQALTTVKLIFKFALLILPSPITLARDTLFITSFTLLTVEEGRKLNKISQQMKKVQTKLRATHDSEKTRLQNKINDLNSDDPKYTKLKQRSDADQETLKTARELKLKNLLKERSDRLINTAFNVLMIATLVFSIVATLLFVSHPYVLIGFAAVGVCAASLGVVKAFRKDE